MVGKVQTEVITADVTFQESSDEGYGSADVTDARRLGVW